MKEVLPIGSVVLLKNAEKRVLVIGYYPTILDEEKEITYDYLACLFPEGIIDSNNSMMFNHEDVDKIFYYGLIDDEQVNFVEKMLEVVNEETKNLDMDMPKVNIQESLIETLD